MAAAGFPDWEIADGEEIHDAVRMQEFVASAIRLLGFFKIELVVGAYSANLSAELKRQPGTVWVPMY